VIAGAGVSRAGLAFLHLIAWTTEDPLVGHLTKPAQVGFCNEGWICEQHAD